jgi:hypothetical protein
VEGRIRQLVTGIRLANLPSLNDLLWSIFTKVRWMIVHYGGVPDRTTFLPDLLQFICNIKWDL